MSTGTRIKSILILTAMVALAFTPLLPTASATNDPANTHAHVDVIGDWTVNDKRTYDGNTIIHMTNGKVTVANGGVLTLDAASILFSAAANGEDGIRVNAGGALIMKTNAWLETSTLTTYYCQFEPGSGIVIEGAFIAHAGQPDMGIPGAQAAVYFGTNNVSVNGLVVYKTPTTAPLVYVGADGIVFKNTTVANENGQAVYVPTGGNATFIDSNIYNAGGTAFTEIGVEGGTLKLDRTSVSLGGIGILGYRGTISLVKSKIHNNTDTGIFLDGFNELDMKDSDVVDNGNVGIYSSLSSDVTIEGDCHILNNGFVGIANLQGSSLNMKGGHIQNHAFANIDIVYYSSVTLDGTYLGYSDAFSNGNIHLESGSSIIAKKITMAKSQGALIFGYQGNDIQVIDSDLHCGGGGICVQGTYSTNIDVRGTTLRYADIGLLNDMVGTINSTKNTYLDTAIIGIFVRLGSEGQSRGDTFKTAENVQIYRAETTSYIDVRNADISVSADPFMVAVAVDETAIEIYDSKVTGTPSNPVLGAMAGSYIKVISTNVPYKSTDVEDISIAEFGWHVNIQTQWQNGAPAPGADLNITDSLAQYDEHFVTDSMGNARMDLLEWTVDSSNAYDHKPYMVNAKLNGIQANTKINPDKDLINANKVIIKLDDNILPDLTITSPAPMFRTSNGTVAVTGTADDLESGLEGTYYKIDDEIVWTRADGLNAWNFNATMDEGVHTVFVQARDNAGKLRDMNVSVIIDQTAPDIQITSPTGYYVTTSKFDLNGSTEVGAIVEVDGVAVTVGTDGNFGTSLTKADGLYNITITATDTVGNMATVHKLLMVDTIAPTLSCDIADGAYFNTPNVKVTGTTDGNFVTVGGKDAAVDLANKTWSIDIVLVEGANNLTIEAKDLAGFKTQKFKVVNVDTLKPTIIIVTPAKNTTLTNKTNATISGKVTHTTALTVNGGTVVFDANGNFTTVVQLTEGMNTIKVKAECRTTCFPADSFFDIFIERDTKPPVVELTSPKNGLVTNAASIQVNGKVDDIKASLNFGTTNVTNSNGTFSTTATLTAGANTITVTATDLAGNSASATITVTQDTACQFAVTKPTKMKVTSTKDSMTITGTSEPGATVYVNGAAIPVGTDGSFTYKLVLKEGKNSIALKAVDLAGNEKSDTLTVTYNDARQFEMGALLGLGIVLMIIGLIIGLVVGRSMAKGKAPPKEEDYPRAPKDDAPKTKHAPEDEDIPPIKDKDEVAEVNSPFSPEEDGKIDAVETDSDIEPEPSKPDLKAKHEAAEAKPAETETKGAKPEKPQAPSKPSSDASAGAGAKGKESDSLEDLLKGLDKKKK